MKLCFCTVRPSLQKHSTQLTPVNRYTLLVLCTEARKYLILCKFSYAPKSRMSHQQFQVIFQGKTNSEIYYKYLRIPSK